MWASRVGANSNNLIPYVLGLGFQRSIGSHRRVYIMCVKEIYLICIDISYVYFSTYTHTHIYIYIHLFVWYLYCCWFTTQRQGDSEKMQVRKCASLRPSPVANCSSWFRWERLVKHQLIPPLDKRSKEVLRLGQVVLHIFLCCTPKIGEMIQFDIWLIFFRWVETSNLENCPPWNQQFAPENWCVAFERRPCYSQIRGCKNCSWMSVRQSCGNRQLLVVTRISHIRTTIGCLPPPINRAA